MAPLNTAPPSAVRWAVWGPGPIARDLCKDIPLVPGAQLVAVGSRSVERARAFAEELSAPRAHEGLASLLADPEVDVVHVATPHHRHAEDTIACLAAGKAVLCEKPLALNLAQATAVAEASERHGVFCMEALWSRFFPAVLRARERVHTGDLGRLRHLQATFGYPLIEDANSRLFRLDQGGGALLDRGVYLLSLARFFLGAPEEILASRVTGSTGVDLQTTLLLRYGSGAQASLTASLVTRLPNELVLSGEAGTLTLHDPFYSPDALTFHPIVPAPLSVSTHPRRGPLVRLRGLPGVQRWRRRLRPVEHLADLLRTERFPFSGGGYQFEIAEVCAAIRRGHAASERHPLSDSLEVLREMDAIRRQWGMTFPQDP